MHSSNNSLRQPVPFLAIFLIMLGLTGFINRHSAQLQGTRVAADHPTIDTPDKRLEITLPKKGKLVDGKPVGKHWVNLLTTLNDWNADPSPWSLSNGVLHGDYNGGKLHNYAWTKKTYTDFELQ